MPVSKCGLKIFTTIPINKIILVLEFIPADESKLFMAVFKWYTWLLFKRRFKRVWIRQEYRPDKQSKTVYYLNHHSWWDGLIPFLLNEFRFRQNARALMEDKQMERYRFFRKIGAFSVNRSDPRKTITSLRYAVQSMQQRDNACLFIYPEGRITPAGSELKFEGGLAWLHSKLENDRVDFVPAGIYMHTIRHDKPELYLYTGSPVNPVPGLSNDDKTRVFEEKLETILRQLRDTAGFDDAGFGRLV